MNTPGPQNLKNTPASPSLLEQSEKQLRDYFLKLTENDEALANVYYDALSPMLLKQALGQMLGSGLDDLFGRATAPKTYEPSKAAASAIRNLHRNVKQETGQRRLPMFQSIEDIKRYTVNIHRERLQRERESALTKRAEDRAVAISTNRELATKPFTTSGWVTAYFAPPLSDDAERDLIFQSRDLPERAANKTRRGLLGMLFGGTKEEETEEHRVARNSVYYLAPVHKGGPIVVEGRVNIREAPAGVTIIATGDVNVDRVGAGAFIVAGGNITVGETGSSAILISGRSVRVKYVGTYARVYARGKAEVGNCGGTICIETDQHAFYPKKKKIERPSPQETAQLIKEFCDVMDTIHNEPHSVGALRQLFAEGIVMLSGGALNLEDVPVMQLPLMKALPAPEKKELSVEEEYREREKNLQTVFARYAGQRFSPSLAENMHREIKAAGYELRILDEDSLMLMDFNHRRVNVKINWDLDGGKYLARKFTLG